MSRLDLIQEIETYERRKVDFQNVLKDVESRYFDKGCVYFDLSTNDFKRNHNDSAIRFDNTLMKDYLKKEIENLENKISEKIDLLKV